MKSREWSIDVVQNSIATFSTSWRLRMPQNRAGEVVQAMSKLCSLRLCETRMNQPRGVHEEGFRGATKGSWTSWFS